MIKAMEKVLFAVDELTGQRPENESNRYCLYYIIKASVESKVEAVGHKKEDFYEQKVTGNHRYAE